MAERRHSRPREGEFTFRNVQLLKNETLGTGSYGAVCKAKCDQLICAAKLLYPSLFQMQVSPGKEHVLPSHRFEQECQFLSRINHPNIVQYLGTYRDPDTNAPVLLMELMDENLTQFLESSPGDIPYHIQVNLSQDIAQALAFLHANGIIHRDLSSSNVLLIAGSRAKVSDFGMSKFMDVDVPRQTTMTQCPGTVAYMAPEALCEPPVYTEKLDNFSYGVILVQVITRYFPNPGNHFSIEQFPDPQNPSRMINVNILIPEVERRKAHISLIKPTHPLLPIALDCLRDDPIERPSSQQLCQLLDALTKEERYTRGSQTDSSQLALTENESQSQEIVTDGQEILSLLRDKVRELQAKEVVIQIKDSVVFAKDREVQALQHEVEAKERQLRRQNDQIESDERTNAMLHCTVAQRDQEIVELQCTITLRDKKINELKEVPAELQCIITQKDRKIAELKELLSRSVEPSDFIMVWETLSHEAGVVGRSSTVIGDVAYFGSGRCVLEVHSTNMQSCNLPKHPLRNFAVVGVSNVLTTVGGSSDHNVDSVADLLYSYVNGLWVVKLPPMPTKRWGPSTVYANYALTVAGGFCKTRLTVVEILNTVSKQWSSVCSLPFSTSGPSASTCGTYIYIHSQSESEEYSVVRCPLVALALSTPSSAIWERTASLPVRGSSLVSVKGHLLAVGGLYSKDVHLYDAGTDSWQVVSQMSVVRSQCIPVVLPDNRLMVVGRDSETIELAIISS